MTDIKSRWDIKGDDVIQSKLKRLFAGIIKQMLDAPHSISMLYHSVLTPPILLVCQKIQKSKSLLNIKLEKYDAHIS